MQWSLDWYDYAFLYAFEYGPYLFLVLFILLSLRDIIKKKLHRSTVIMGFIMLVVLLVVRLLAGVI